MQWRKWQKWGKIKLYAKSGPLKSGDFGENGKFGWRKWRHGWPFKLDTIGGPLGSGDFGDNGKNGDFGEKEFICLQIKMFISPSHAMIMLVCLEGHLLLVTHSPLT